MSRGRVGIFTTIRTEGGLLSGELLARVAEGDATLPGLRAEDYHLASGERVGEMVTRSWNRLTAAWKGFAEALAAVSESEATATSITRERWLLVLFAELGFGRLQAARTVEVDGKAYPVSHEWASVPIHLVGAKVDLDRRTHGVRGAAGASPHALVQELLNRSVERLWGMVSNGRRLRLLRDNASLTRQAFVEFDLETMLADEVFDDFVVLWLLCHQSRVEGDPTSCWLEQWSAEAAAAGIRALDTLRDGVETAIATLGGGFLAHPANTGLRERLRSGALSTQDYYRQLLRSVYRLLFLFVAEDRGLLHDPAAPESARRRYTEHYSLARLRDLAGRRRGGPHPDLWQGLRVVLQGLGTPAGVPALGLPALGSFLWSSEACPDLDDAELANRDLLAAVFALAWIQDRDGKVLRPVDYRNLGAEELGSVYESLLEQHPEFNVDAATFTLATAAGNERKTTGSYYTPTGLIVALLDSALDPVLNEAVAMSEPEAAILGLKVLDPACGSGHFLIAAAHRIAKRLAAVRSGEDEPAPEAVRRALREVIGHCIYGVDVNPMAVELCKVGLWMEALEPGKPLSFLDHHVVCGNSLLGTTPALLAGGIPEEAFKELTGDQKSWVTSLRKQNKAERAGQESLFTADLRAFDEHLVEAAQAVDEMADDVPSAVEAKALRWSKLLDSDSYQRLVFAADTWCAAFVAPKTPDLPAITESIYRTALNHPDRIDEAMRAVIATAAQQYGFLHWNLAFLDVYAPDGKGGFDVMLGNPPWEKVKLAEKEFFAARAPEVSAAAGAKRKALIANLRVDDPALWHEYQAALRVAEGESHLLRNSGRYPLCGRGDVNTYAVFAEAARSGLGQEGRLGMIVPSGIATDDTTKDFFAEIVDTRSLVSLFEFENEGFFRGAGQGHMLRFCLLTIAAPGQGPEGISFLFRGTDVAELNDDERRFTLAARDLRLFNPNTRTAPIFRTRRDAVITKQIYSKVPVLVRDEGADPNPWETDLSTMFHMTNDSSLFQTSQELLALGAQLQGNMWRLADQTWVPLYEAKMFNLFDHRAASYEGLRVRAHQLPESSASVKGDPDWLVQPWYWVSKADLPAQMRSWHLVWRDTTDARASARTVIVCVLPNVAIGNKAPLLYSPVESRLAALLAVIMSSFAFDYATRQKIGGTTLNFFIVKQLPVVGPVDLKKPCSWSTDQSFADWLSWRMLELTYTAWDLSGFAADMGWRGAPFRWIPERREMLRAELDGAMFHLYGLERDDVDYVMETFPIVRRKDERSHGEYRTKRIVLERYDAMAKASISGEPYRTVLVPPPADPTVAHPSKS